MIQQVNATIKNIANWTGGVGKVTLFTGDNRSGKTAIAEAVRLALTNTCSVGATPTKQSLLTSGDASATIKGDKLLGKWSYAGGKRSFSLEYDGMQVQSLTGDAPLTVQEFWALTGEQRWTMVESIVGTFDEEPPQPVDKAKAELKTLRGQLPPEEYTGPSLPELERLQAHYKSVIEQAAKARQEISAREYNLRADRQSLENAENIWATLQSNLRNYTLAKEEDLVGQLDWALREWETDASTVLVGGNLQDAFKHMAERLELEREAIADLCAPDQDSDYTRTNDVFDLRIMLEDVAVKLTALGSNEVYSTYLFDSGQKFIDRIIEIGSKYAIVFDPNSVCTPELARKRISRVGADIDAQITRCNDMIKKSESGIAQLKARIAEMEAWAPPKLADAVKAAEELETVEKQLAHAKAVANWLAYADKRLERITELEQLISDYDTKQAEFSKRRAAYLDGAASLVSGKANEILTAMGFPLVGIRIETTGKRNKLTAVADGVDIQAMAGSEQLLYGVALVNALHELGKAKLPVLFVEAAELSGENLTKLLGALAKYRTRGNVFVSHWYPVVVNGVVTHKF